MVNPPRRHINLNYVYSKKQSCKICEAKTEQKGEIDKLTTVVRDFNNCFSTIGRTTRTRTSN